MWCINDNEIKTPCTHRALTKAIKKVSKKGGGGRKKEKAGQQPQTDTRPLLIVRHRSLKV